MKETGIIVLSAIFFLTSHVYAADQGKIAVAAEDRIAAAMVSGVAARTLFFLIFDGSGKFLEAVDNPYRAAGGGAGISVVPFLEQKGVTVVVAGEFGKNMINAMQERGMRYMEFRGSAEEALKKVMEGKK